jgi:hypothetical protein
MHSLFISFLETRLEQIDRLLYPGPTLRTSEPTLGWRGKAKREVSCSVFGGQIPVLLLGVTTWVSDPFLYFTTVPSPLNNAEVRSLSMEPCIGLVLLEVMY